MSEPNRWDAVISDLDGCLASERGGPFDLARLGVLAEHNRLAQAQADRPVITVCTGRPQPFAEAMCRVLANTTLPCVAENGVWLYHPGDNRYEQDPAIEPAHLAAVADAARLLRERYAPLGVTQQPAKTASVTLFHPDRQVLIERFEEVQGMLADRGWPFRVSMTVDYINCDLRHISKASGLRRWFDATGIDPARCVGLGDTGSDLPIAEACGWFGRPANGAEVLEAASDYTSPHDELAGTLDILRTVGALRD
ncbi:MAG: hypothetical protein AAF805_11970 [Planctomycetota bacterium]